MAVHLYSKSARSVSRPWVLALGLLRVATGRVAKKLKLILLLLSAVLAVEVSADSGNSLNGIWVVDAAATERAVLEMAPQAEAAQIARGFLVVGGYFTNVMFVMEDESVTGTYYGDTRFNWAKFKLITQSQTQRKYERTDQKSPNDDGLTITVLNRENIRIEGQKILPILLWKRVLPQQTQKREDYDAHNSTWFAAIKRITDHLFAQDIQQTPPVPPKRWSEDVELGNRRRILVEREVRYTFKHSMGDAGSGFGLFKNKLRNHRLQFRHPKTGKRIDWQGDPSFTPVLLDLIDGVPYLVLSAKPTKETERVYSCTELPFVYLQHDTKSPGTWRAVPEDQAPRALKMVNLSFVVKEDEGEDKLKEHLSVAQVQETIAQEEKSSRGFIQRDIPRDYKEWRYQYKKSYRNERMRDDCRPPRAPLPQMVLPAPVEGTPEILETVDYTPERIIGRDDWSILVFDKKRQDACEKLFRPADPEDDMQGQRFVQDSSGKKPVPYSRTVQFNSGVRVLCDGDEVWFITHLEEPEKIVISKFTVTGDLVLRTSFRKPERIKGFSGYIRVPSLRSESGYLYFDWLDSENINGTPYIKRWLKMRMQQPESDKPTPSTDSGAAR